MNWWRHVVSMEMRKILAYRSDFWVTFIGQTLVQLLVARALWQSIFSAEATQTINGYNLETITLYYMIVPIGSRMLAGENIGFISREIYDGTFNRYLIYPLSFFQYKTLTYLTHSFFYSLPLVLVFLIYRLFLATPPFSIQVLGYLGAGILLFFLASFAYAMLAMLVELLALWADNIWSLLIMLRFTTSFLGGGLIPLSFFPKKSLEFLKYTPFPYFVSLPARTIMGETTQDEVFQGILILLVWSLVLMEVIRFLWKRGQKNYTGVGI